MNKYLTIGELAKLLNTSTYNIRYYEKEGLIKSNHLSDGGFRLYDYDEVYTLNAIMILRDSDIPIKDVKKLVDNYSTENYIMALKKSYDKVSEEIKRLEVLQKEIAESLDIANNYDTNERKFSYKQLSNRNFFIIKNSDYQMNYSIKDLYDIYDKNNIDMTQMYKSDSYFILYDNHISLCLLDDSSEYNLESIQAKKGKYLSYSFFVKDEMEIEKRVEDLFKYIIKNKIKYEGELIFIVGVKASMVSESGYIGELQIKIK